MNRDQRPVSSASYLLGWLGVWAVLVSAGAARAECDGRHEASSGPNRRPSAAVVGVQATPKARVFEAVDRALEARDSRKAAAELAPLAQTQGEEFEYLWRLSRVQVLLGDLEAAKSRTQEQHYVEALATAERAIAREPLQSMGYIRRAAASGKVALFRGIGASSLLVNQLKRDVDRALELNTAGTRGRAIAHYILGRAHLELTKHSRFGRMLMRLDWGNLPEAIKHLAQAVELEPTLVMFRLEYGLALAADGKRESAIRELEQALVQPLQEQQDEDRQAQARTELARLRAKS